MAEYPVEREDRVAAAVSGLSPGAAEVFRKLAEDYAGMSVFWVDPETHRGEPDWQAVLEDEEVTVIVIGKPKEER
jgi:hypothetical protein